MEIAGLTFAVIPLTSSVVRTCKKIYQLFMIFDHRYAEEVMIFRRRLVDSSYHFECECSQIHLLSRTGQQSAVPRDFTHPLWNERASESNLESQLDQAYWHCLSKAQMIEQSYLDLLKRTESLSVLLQQVR